MNPNRIDRSNIDAIRVSDGVAILANRSGDPITFGVTLTNGVTYVFPFGGELEPVASEIQIAGVQFRWDASIIATISVADTLFPATLGGEGIDVTDHSATAGLWIPENPSTAYIPVVGGTFNAANMTVTVPGGSAGGCIFHLGNLSSRRVRGNVAVGGTGGLLRCGVWGKGA